MTGIRAKQKEDTRDKVLAAARKLFVDKAFDQVGVRDIAQEAGVATGTVIAAFGSKGDLLNAILIEDFRAQKVLIERAAIGATGLADRMLRMMTACAAYQAHQLPILRAGMADSWVRPTDAEHRIRKAIQPMMAFIVEEVRAAAARGELREGLDFEVVGQIILEAQLNTYRLAIYDNVPMTALEPHLAARLNIILGGIAAQSQVQFGSRAA